jgi:hypothetical protein
VLDSVRIVWTLTLFVYCEAGGWEVAAIRDNNESHCLAL